MVHFTELLFRQYTLFWLKKKEDSTAHFPSTYPAASKHNSTSLCGVWWATECSTRSHFVFCSVAGKGNEPELKIQPKD